MEGGFQKLLAVLCMREDLRRTWKGMLMHPVWKIEQGDQVAKD